jgi:uncharacterized membrane protein
MLYLWIKYIHVLSSTVLFGTGIGTASIMFYGHLTKDTRVISAITRYVVLADWLFTATSGIVQPLTGFWMVHLAGYSFKLPWVWGSIVGYCIAGCCWFPVVYFQIQMRDFAVDAELCKKPLPIAYYRYFKYWFCLGWPAFISLLIVFYLMTNNPF